jgi:YjbE family integral membrane protein
MYVMELFSSEFVWGLLAVVMIDLVLAGDNAIVIGMAARNVPLEQRKKTIILGTIGAIGIRIAATGGVVYLLDVPGLMVIGGLLLLRIAYKLLADGQQTHEIEAKDSLVAAVRTIVVADAVMGIDNVLAVAGAAHGSFLLLTLGLLISVPVVVWGSTFFVKCIDRYPVVIYAGSGILAWTAAKMIIGEPLLASLVQSYPDAQWAAMALAVLAVLGGGWLQSRPVPAPVRIDSNRPENY